MGISKNINDFLELKSMNASELARRSGVAQARISEIVTGKTKNPRGETLQKIAAALDVSMDALLSGPSPPVGCSIDPQVLRDRRERKEKAAATATGEKNQDSERGSNGLEGSISERDIEMDEFLDQLEAIIKSNLSKDAKYGVICDIVAGKRVRIFGEVGKKKGTGS